VEKVRVEKIEKRKVRVRLFSETEESGRLQLDHFQKIKSWWS
jgi:hypothetical protein